MTLQTEIEAARRQIVTDGYDMSLGELVNLYKSAELTINPAFQRLFRWDASQKTRFLESLLLGIPIPPLFVFQTKGGQWELVDGLQRMSTVLEFLGELKNDEGALQPYSVLEGTEMLPSLVDKYWKAQADDDPSALTVEQQLQIKRARVRLEILKKESDEDAKFELFQRLNTGGSPLSPQEVRTCVMVMINRHFSEWLTELTALPSFVETVQMSDAARSEQRPAEMALRFLAVRRLPYRRGLDVNEYLDRATIQLARTFDAVRAEDDSTFRDTFGLIAAALGSNAFKRWDGNKHSGQFLVSGFEVIAPGVAANLPAILALGVDSAKDFVRMRSREIWSNPVFVQNSGMGVRGTTRLLNLIPLGGELFRP